MGLSCCKCPKNALYKSMILEENSDNNSNKFGENNNKFPSQKSVIAHNQKILNQNNKNPGRNDWKNPSSNPINSLNQIYELDEEIEGEITE